MLTADQRANSFYQNVHADMCPFNTIQLVSGYKISNRLDQHLPRFSMNRILSNEILRLELHKARVYLLFKTYNTLSIGSSLNFNRFDIPGNFIVHLVKSSHDSQEVSPLDLRHIVNLLRYLSFFKFIYHGGSN
jgi:hypothetical protein